MPGEALAFMIVLYMFIYIHLLYCRIARSDVHVFQLPALVRRCRLTRALCVIDGLFEVGGELVLAVLLDGHEGWVLRTLLL